MINKRKMIAAHINFSVPRPWQLIPVQLLRCAFMDFPIGHRRSFPDEKTVYTQLIAKSYECTYKGIRDVINVNIGQSAICIAWEKQRFWTATTQAFNLLEKRHQFSLIRINTTEHKFRDRSVQ